MQPLRFDTASCPVRRGTIGGDRCCVRKAFLIFFCSERKWLRSTNGTAMGFPRDEGNLVLFSVFVSHKSQPEIEFLINNHLCKLACDTPIALVTGCIHHREGYRPVTSLLIPGSTGLRVKPCSMRGNYVTGIEGYKIRQLWNSGCINAVR